MHGGDSPEGTLAPCWVKFPGKVTAAEAHTLQTYVVSVKTIVSVLSLLSLRDARRG